MLAESPDSDYGSEGWGFESVRACDGNPCSAWASLIEVCDSCGDRLRILDDSLLVRRELSRGRSGRISVRARDHDELFQTLLSAGSTTGSECQFVYWARMSHSAVSAGSFSPSTSTDTSQATCTAVSRRSTALIAEKARTRDLTGTGSPNRNDSKP